MLRYGVTPTECDDEDDVDKEGGGGGSAAYKAARKRPCTTRLRADNLGGGAALVTGSISLE
jgi:hypothetical protein